MLRLFRMMTCWVCLMALVPSAHAGKNAGASVELSWDANALRSTPSGFPLCLAVYDARDLRQLAIHVSWTPYDPGGDCFRLKPAGKAGACDSLRALPVGASLEDSSYVWTVLFASAPASPQYLIYWITGTSCDSTASPRFLVTDVRALDSSGASDTLTSRGCVILNNSMAFGVAALTQSIPHIPTGEMDETLPTRLALFASPNPLVGAAMLRFDLPGPIPYRLAIYDVSGALVLDANPVVRAQRGSFRWDLTRRDGERVRPGVYFARLTNSAGSRVVPLTVLK